MFCGDCGAQNREGRKFCTRCGSALDALCPSCAAPIDPQDEFCGECGTSLQSAQASRSVARTGHVAERRLVSVLFADLVGFTAHSEGRDPEEVRGLLSRYFEKAQEIIELYGGVVEKFIGDAVMAVWGTPIAREDDAERAVRASLELIDSIKSLGTSVGAELAARAGIYTGEAAVNLAAKSQGMVAGDMVNSAARLQSVAEPGTTLVDRGTYLATRSAIQFEEIGPKLLKGKEEPLETWRPLRAIGGVGGIRKADALEPPFTGRHEELRLIKDLLHATGRERKPRLASVVGIGGIGKSRLVWELFKYIDGLSETIWWHVGRSPSYGEGVAFWSLAEMVRMRAGIAETDDETVAIEKLDACLHRYFPDPEEMQWLRPPLAQLLGFEEGAEESKEALFAAWRTFFERIAEDGTVVLVFEDLHWADPGLVDFIDHVMAWARTSPIFVLTLARPELTDRHTTWGSGQRNFVNVHLERLDDEDMVLLMKGIANDLPPAVQDEIIERAEGVPLYAVEMVRMLIDRNSLVPQGSGYSWVGGDQHVDVPDSLHSLIASRLDCLPTEDRLLVQDASVLGKTFTLNALAAVSSTSADELEPRLEDLARKEILVVDRDPRSPERGQYGFVQSLISEVAYQTLANQNRRDCHLRAATYFESLEEPDLIDVIATHYVEAFNNSPKNEESQQLGRRALTALREAAKRARALGSNEQSLALSEKALLIASQDGDRAELLLEGGVAANACGQIDKSINLLRASVELLAKMERTSLLGEARNALGNAYFVAARMDEAEQMLLEAAEELEDPETDPSAGAVYSELARVYVFKGEFEKGDAYSILAMPPAERAGNMPVIADTLITRAVSSLLSGRIHEAEALLAGALKLSRDHGLIRQQLRALINTSANQLQMHPRISLQTCKDGLVIARRYGQKEAEAYLVNNGMEAGVYLAEWDWLRGVIADLSDQMGEIFYIVLGGRAVTEAYQGNVEEAGRLLDEMAEAVKDSISQQDHQSLAFARAVTAFVNGDYERALVESNRDPSTVGEKTIDFLALNGRAAIWTRNLGEARKVRQEMDRLTIRNDLVESHRTTLDAGIALLEGDEERAGGLYQQALQAWRALDIPTYLALCQMDVALLFDDPAADAARDSAEAFFTEAGNMHLVRQLQSGLN